MNKYEENLSVIGKMFDLTEFSANVLLDELFPDRSKYLLGFYEGQYQLKSGGSLTDRQGRIVSAIRAKGGLSKAYLKNVGDALGAGRYTIAVTEGSGSPAFILHSNPAIATALPGVLRDEPITDSCFTLTVTVTGGVSPETELEVLMEKLNQLGQI